MRRRNRLFYKNIIHHIYQRSVDGFLLFYNISDYLVYFTIMCITAQKYGVRLLMTSFMPDHIHHSACAERVRDMSDFMKETTRLYAVENNLTCHREGPLFRHPFGSAPKNGDKKGRSNLIYVGNNGPERHLSEKAEDYRWSFLAYAKSAHPFSEPLIIHEASAKLQRAVKEVSICAEQWRYLHYNQLQRMFRGLEKREKKQLTDFIISTYNIIDYESASELFDSYEDMIAAMHSNIGSEYDLNEVFIGKSDAHYAKMVSIVMKEYGLRDIHDMFKLSIGQRFELFNLLKLRTDAFPEQIAAFLRLPVKKPGI